MASVYMFKAKAREVTLLSIAPTFFLNKRVGERSKRALIALPGF